MYSWGLQWATNCQKPWTSLHSRRVRAGRELRGMAGEGQLGLGQRALYANEPNYLRRCKTQQLITRYASSVSLSGRWSHLAAVSFAHSFPFFDSMFNFCLCGVQLKVTRPSRPYYIPYSYYFVSCAWRTRLICRMSSLGLRVRLNKAINM